VKRLATMTVMLAGLALYPQLTRCAASRPADQRLRTEDGAAAGRLVRTWSLAISYGQDEGSPAFVPAGNEHEALGPDWFEVTDEGSVLIADRVRRELLELHPESADPTALEAVGSLDSRGAPPGGYGEERGGPAVRTAQTSAESGAVIFGEGPSERSVAIDAGGPLASLELIGVDAEGRAFVLLERFCELGEVEVEREVLVVRDDGLLLDRMRLEGGPEVAQRRELLLADDGSLYRMLTREEQLVFSRWELRP
jgi:hypothetical protein